MDANLELLSMLAVLGVFVLFFAVPIVAIIAFVQMRKKSRSAMLAEPWGALAEKWGGEFREDQIFCQDGVRQFTVEMVLVSVMGTAGNPEFSDGGTYTRSRLAFAPDGDFRILATDERKRIHLRGLVERVPLAGRLPDRTDVVLGAREAVIVRPGVVTDKTQLMLYKQVLRAIEDDVRANGPIMVE